MSKLPVRELKPLSPKTEATLELVKALFPVVVSIFTAIWIAFQFFDAKQKDREQLDRQLAAQESEARKPFNDLQLKMYQEMARIGGDLVLLGPSTTSGAYVEVQSRFDALYWSSLSMVEDRQVELAMINLDRALQNFGYDSRKLLNADDSQLRKVRDRVYCLALAMKGSIGAAWKVNLNSGPPIPANARELEKQCDTQLEPFPANSKLKNN
jgi:hypothetical protein